MSKNGSREEKDLPLANVAKARLLLGIGAIAGLHRLYLKQIPEAFIFLSTGGIFLFGPVHDMFLVNRLVHEYNDELVDESMEKERDVSIRKKDRHSWFSMTSIYDLLAMISYGMWLGICLYLACTFFILTGPLEQILFAFFLAIGVTSATFFRENNDLGLLYWSEISKFGIILCLACFLELINERHSIGVYIAGNRKNQVRKLSFIWIGAFSTSFLTVYLWEFSIIRSLFFTALGASLIGNRGLRLRAPNETKFKIKHYIFWSSLFAMVLCVIYTGIQRNILERQLHISTTAKTRHIISVGSMVSDYARGETKELQRIFRDNPPILYMPYLRKPTWTKQTSKKSKSSKTNEWFSGIKNSLNWDLSVVDEKKQSKEFTWIKLVTTFVVDYVRVNVRLIGQKKSLDVEPLKWVAWRLYTISSFDADYFTNDKELVKMCQKWSKDQQSINDSEKTKWQKISRLRACEVINSIFCQS